MMSCTGRGFGKVYWAVYDLKSFLKGFVYAVRYFRGVLLMTQCTEWSFGNDML